MHDLDKVWLVGSLGVRRAGRGSGQTHSVVLGTGATPVFFFLLFFWCFAGAVLRTSPAPSASASSGLF